MYICKPAVYSTTHSVVGAEEVQEGEVMTEVVQEGEVMAEVVQEGEVMAEVVQEGEVMAEAVVRVPEPTLARAVFVTVLPGALVASCRLDTGRHTRQTYKAGI
jgi:hypothetical protein